MYTELIKQLNQLKAYSGYWILYIASWVIIMKIKSNAGKEYLGKQMLLVGIIIFNPIVAIILNICMESSYWRSVWLLQECFIISFAAVLLLKQYEKKKKLIVTLVLFLIIGCAGRNMYINNHFSKPENVYKIPEEMIEICEIIKNNCSEAYVASVYPVYIWIRQYDATIGLRFGKNGGELELRDLVQASERDYEYLHIKLTEEECNILIIKLADIVPSELEMYGFEFIDCTVQYAVYRVL